MNIQKAQKPANKKHLRMGFWSSEACAAVDRRRDGGRHLRLHRRRREISVNRTPPESLSLHPYFLSLISAVRVRLSNPNSRAGELCDGLGSLRDGVLSQLPRKHQPHGGLDLARGYGRLLVVPRETGRLLGELLKDVVDEAVHDTHGLARDPDVRVNLLQNLEDVDLVSLNALLRPLLLLVAGGAALLGKFLPGLGLLLRRGLLGGRLLLGGGLLLGLGCHIFREREGGYVWGISSEKFGEG
ncbi:cell division control 48-E-like protein [Striga asiatica]|uniref:Cell division control 48-E-like protein n=1 Tax=Striga asiatica TaxID=4170 RepID=A0A5A7R8E7_STRAF|nr:cell division control 48-E-like protein [Striga asiatica]